MVLFHHIWYSAQAPSKRAACFELLYLWLFVIHNTTRYIFASASPLHDALNTSALSQYAAQ